MVKIFVLLIDYWPYLLAAAIMLAVAIGLVVYLFRLKDDIRLNRKVETLSGSVPTEEATQILRRMRDSTTEDTILAILPTLVGTKMSLRQSGLPISLIQYISAIIGICSLIAILWPNPLVPAAWHFLEPVVYSITLHIVCDKWVLKTLVGFRKAKLVDQLAAFISHIGRAIQVGQSADSAVTSAAQRAPYPLRKELADVLKLNGVGIPIEQALRATGQNIDLPEFDFFVSALEASMKSGGNLSGVLEELVGVIRARRHLKMKVGALTAEGKLSAFVLALLPIGLFTWLNHSYPKYVEPMFTNEFGQIMMVGGFFLIVFGLLIMLRMVKLKV